MVARFLTVDDVADELATTRVQILALLRSGELPAIKIGGCGQWRIERSRFEEWMAEQYATTARFIARQAQD